MLDNKNLNFLILIPNYIKESEILDLGRNVLIRLEFFAIKGRSIGIFNKMQVPNRP